ncbi:hypothetical protein [Tepidiforma sp.]|uniref:hypothetical protein n=1 Tax=Tepidiforma sp. TaxID=2682230 RepID=UPI002ADD7DAA|nr:hypothetical protein [Tepidiforma sp.]
MDLDPVAVTERIGASYRRYLRTLLRTNDPAMNAGLEDALERTSSLVIGPVSSPRRPFARADPWRSWQSLAC